MDVVWIWVGFVDIRLEIVCGVLAKEGCKVGLFDEDAAVDDVDNKEDCKFADDDADVTGIAGLVAGEVWSNTGGKKFENLESNLKK